MGGSLEGKVFPYVGIVADLTGHCGSQFLALPVATCAIGVVCGGNESAHVYRLCSGRVFQYPWAGFSHSGSSSSELGI